MILYLLLYQKIQISWSCNWLVMLSMEPALFRRRSSRAKATAASRDLATIRDLFTSPVHLTKPERWHLPEGSISEGMAYCTMIFNIRRQWQDPEMFLFIRGCYEKLGRMLEPLVPKFRPDLLSVSASQGPVFRQYPLNGRIYQNETSAQSVSACDLIFRSIFL